MTDRSAPACSSFELLLQGKLEPAQDAQAPALPGAQCPQCGQGRLEYNGLLVLQCPECGYAAGGGGGCT